LWETIGLSYLKTALLFGLTLLCGFGWPLFFDRQREFDWTFLSGRHRADDGWEVKEE
jgi:hypothetical protein